MTAPETRGRLQWTVEAAAKDGRQRDRLVFDQMIETAVPIETWAATLFRVGADTSLPIASPAGALPGGYVDTAIPDTLAPPLSGVRDYMANHPYDCFEQQKSPPAPLGRHRRWPVPRGAGATEPQVGHNIF